MNNPQRLQLSETNVSLNVEVACIIIQALVLPPTPAGFPQCPGPVP